MYKKYLTDNARFVLETCQKKRRQPELSKIPAGDIIQVILQKPGCYGLNVVNSEQRFKRKSFGQDPGR